MNIEGIWIYKEDFGFGKSEGEVEFIQSGIVVTGIFSFTEKVENNYEINVIEKTKGTISEGKLFLESTEVKAIQDGKQIHYLPNTFDVHLVSEDKLVGSTFDTENVCGVFVLDRKRSSE